MYLEDFKKHCDTCTWAHGRKDTDKLDRNIRALKMVMSGEYVPEGWDLHDKRWGKLGMRTKKIKGSTDSRIVLYRAKARTKAQKRQERKEWGLLLEVEDKARESALARIGKLMSVDIFSYWC